MNQVQKYLPLGLLFAFICKLLTSGTTLAECGVVFALTALASLDKYLEKSKRIAEVETSMSAKLKEIEDIVKQQNQVILKISSELDQARTNITGIKMAQGMKSVR